MTLAVACLVPLLLPQGVTAQQIVVPTGGLDTSFMDRLRSLVGLVVLTAMAWGLSLNRSKIQWRVVGWGLALQLVFAVFILKTAVGATVFDAAGDVVVGLLGFTLQGSER